MGNEFVTLTLDGYTIYINNNGYYLCMSSDQVSEYQVYIGFTNKDLDGLSKESIVKEIRKVSDLILSSKSGIYILPVIPSIKLEEAALENDGIGYRKIMNNNVQPIVREVVQVLASQNKKVNPVITMIKQTDIDRKFIDGVMLQILAEYKRDDFVRGIEYEELRKIQMSSSLVAADRNNATTPPPPPEGGIAPMRHYEDDTSLKSNKAYSKKLTKPNSNQVSPGYSNIGFITLILITSIILGIGIGYLLLK